MSDAEAIARIAENRSNLSLASQVLYQSRVLLLLERLAKQGKGGLVLELLRDPVKLQTRYQVEYQDGPQERVASLWG
jgi:hypothetical protein